MNDDVLTLPDLPGSSTGEPSPQLTDCNAFEFNGAESKATELRAWDASFFQRLDDVTIRSPLTADIAPSVLIIAQGFGFALLESEPTSLTASAIRQRSDQLQAFGAALGVPLVQSPRCELVEDVKDYSDIEVGDDRGYRSGGELSPHSDPPTLLVLHCVQPAKEGGESSLVSVASIVQRMMTRDLNLVRELFEPLPEWRVAGQYGIDVAGPGTPRPVLAKRDEIISCVLYRPYIEKGAEATGTKLSGPQIAALDMFEEYSKADDLTLRFVLKPGQTLVLHNRSVLHARTNFVDWPELDRRRHLLRMWIDAPDSFPVNRVHHLGDFFAPLPDSDRIPE